MKAMRAMTSMKVVKAMIGRPPSPSTIVRGYSVDVTIPRNSLRLFSHREISLVIGRLVFRWLFMELVMFLLIFRGIGSCFVTLVCFSLIFHGIGWFSVDSSLNWLNFRWFFCGLVYFSLMFHWIGGLFVHVSWNCFIFRRLFTELINSSLVFYGIGKFFIDF